MSLLRVLTVTFLFGGALAHGNHPPSEVDDLSWAERHMQEEHHIFTFDAGAFFRLHDFDNSGTWTRDEILRTYGLSQPDCTASEETKRHVWSTIFDLININRDGDITMQEFQAFAASGNMLPDFGLGPGHHGDLEYEYEVHHFEKHHGGEGPGQEVLDHPEDIEHFRKHDEDEDQEFAQAMLDLSPINEKNIPSKFRIHS